MLRIFIFIMVNSSPCALFLLLWASANLPGTFAPPQKPAKIGTIMQEEKKPETSCNVKPSSKELDKKWDLALSDEDFTLFGLSNPDEKPEKKSDMPGDKAKKNEKKTESKDEKNHLKREKIEHQIVTSLELVRTDEDRMVPNSGHYSIAFTLADPTAPIVWGQLTLFKKHEILSVFDNSRTHTPLVLVMVERRVEFGEFLDCVGGRSWNPYTHHCLDYAYQVLMFAAGCCTCGNCNDRYTVDGLAKCQAEHKGAIVVNEKGKELLESLVANMYLAYIRGMAAVGQPAVAVAQTVGQTAIAAAMAAVTAGQATVAAAQTAGKTTAKAAQTAVAVGQTAAQAGKSVGLTALSLLLKPIETVAPHLVT